MRTMFKALIVGILCVFFVECGKAGDDEDSGVLDASDASQSGITPAPGESGETQGDTSQGGVVDNGTTGLPEPEESQAPEEVVCPGDCDDGLWCNGQEICVSGICVRGSLPDCSTRESCFIGFCNEDIQGCDSAPDLNVADKDGDTYWSLNCGGEDCYDLDYEISPGTDEKCDGVDNNCDGQTDEDCICEEGKTQVCGRDQGICEFGTQVCTTQNDGRILWSPCTGGAPSAEICDDLDNDCDGTIDNEVKNACGECGETPSDGPPFDCDWQDNNCDGVADEGCVCRNDELQPCDVGLGECKKGGIQFCKNGFWDEICMGATAPEDEFCDGRDNNCDGETDEDFDLASNPQHCGICNWKCLPEERCEKGRCLADNSQLLDAGIDAGIVVDGGTDGGLADAGIPDANVGIDAGVCVAQTEICDNFDNDCDGQTDESLTRACSTACGSGTETCQNGLWKNCTAQQTMRSCKNYTTCLNEAKCVTTCPSAPSELCDSKDNDCDGTVDEDFGNKGQSCTAGVGECVRTGTFVCKTDKTGTQCSATAGTPATSETCDNKDNDCDGMTDSADADIVATNCEKQNAVCHGKKHSVAQCVAGSWQVCGATQYGLDYEVTETRCDNFDNDCDGQTDESLTRACSTACGSGTETCQNGLWKNCTAIQPTEEIYGDGRDNDCDGLMDEDLRFLSCNTVTLNGTYSFDVCHIKQCTTLTVSSSLGLTCRLLTIEQGGTIQANAVGNSGLCNGGNGEGGGPNACGGGGGGACSAGFGAIGGYCPWRQVGKPGAGGTAVYGTASGSDQFAGSRGGNGGVGTIVYNPIQPGTYNYGALGGGVIAITVTESATIAGTIAVKGGDGDQRGWNICDDGAGGGGSGGTALLRTPLLTFGASAIITANGGKGGKGGSSCGYGGGGGGGGGGRIKIKVTAQTVF
ncbi:MAG: putative metal-binding motif-containing protein, partial [Patescibacteria group bacterium]